MQDMSQVVHWDERESRKRARQEELQWRFAVKVASFCPVWCTGYSQGMEEPQFLAWRHGSNPLPATMPASPLPIAPIAPPTPPPPMAPVAPPTPPPTQPKPVERLVLSIVPSAGSLQKCKLGLQDIRMFAEQCLDVDSVLWPKPHELKEDLQEALETLQFYQVDVVRNLDSFVKSCDTLQESLLQCFTRLESLASDALKSDNISEHIEFSRKLYKLKKTSGLIQSPFSLKLTSDDLKTTSIEFEDDESSKEDRKSVV
jgi:hypothetical protein